MSTEYVGSVTLYVGATEVEVTKIDVKNITGKKEVTLSYLSQLTK